MTTIMFVLLYSQIWHVAKPGDEPENINVYILYMYTAGKLSLAHIPGPNHSLELSLLPRLHIPQSYWKLRGDRVWEQG